MVRVRWREPGKLLDAMVDLFLFAGYMKRLGPSVLAAFGGRILNTHPALLPTFGGRGMYGDRVFEAVLRSGELVVETVAAIAAARR